MVIDLPPDFGESDFEDDFTDSFVVIVVSAIQASEGLSNLKTYAQIDSPYIRIPSILCHIYQRISARNGQAPNVTL